MVREKEGAKKRREEVHSHRGTVLGDFGKGGNTLNVSGKRLRCRSAQESEEHLMFEVTPALAVMMMLKMRPFRVNLS
jgi:hypothetical protein